MRHALSSPTRRAFYFGVALLFTLCAAASSPAAAQEDGTQQEALPLDPELPYCASGDGGPRRSPARAMLCSLGYTAGPTAGGALLSYAGLRLGEGDRGGAGAAALQYVAAPLATAGGALFLGGLLVGPSVGSWYARDGHTARVGVGLRAGGSALVVTASTAIVLNALGEALAFFIFPFGDPPEWSYWRGWDVMLAGGALTVAGGALLNLVAAPIAAQGGRRDGNEAQASLSVRPRLDPAGEQAGLTVTVGL